MSTIFGRGRKRSSAVCFATLTVLAGCGVLIVPSADANQVAGVSGGTISAGDLRSAWLAALAPRRSAYPKSTGLWRPCLTRQPMPKSSRW